MKANGPVYFGAVGSTSAGANNGLAKNGIKHIIHVSVPVYGQTSKIASEILLASCMLNTLNEAARNGSTSVSIETFTNKLYNYPREEVAFIMQSFAARWAALGECGNVKTIRFVNPKDKHILMFKAFLGAIYKDDKGQK